ncbi:alpha,alpha-trehalose-phosphate synthase (UDP-forming) [Rathayibacter soli]|uniref:alpha,alpha-trehalose-phosphate synthase (UDP-forming) n=1 Tax=Rathayibacter soli TaxID=3144168 RepID=UPI0027E56449|nr:trehalose-6-phosphate synthase [Glaciibacter superstes]
MLWLGGRHAITAHNDAATAADATTFDLVIVSNRLPVDHVSGEGDDAVWRPSPGGLVAALEPVMKTQDGVWIGWVGIADAHFEPFVSDGIDIVPITLSEQDVRYYYEGFSNDTLWPLYHDVIAPPSFHREWWDSYVAVNTRFAEAAIAAAAHGAVIWVHDYQLQLVPKMIRDERPDVVIGFFNHIPFPAYGIYSQLPWRRQIVEGLLGADVIGFQRLADAANFARAARRLKGFDTRGSVIEVPIATDDPDAGSHRHVTRNRRGQLVRTVLVRQFPISIDARAYQDLARRPEIQARARQIREELGNPKTIMLGVDRLDYTKGIGHRLKAFGELLRDGSISVEDVTLVQVASPSRERVATYKLLRDEIELTVGRINGDYSTISHTAINYFHQGYPREEMVALYLAADIMLVTALRDGMNLVAKEYAASRVDEDGVLILSEFTGASDELRQALLINPHDIEGVKDAMLRAIGMPTRDRTRRMRALRKRVLTYDVRRWSSAFLEALTRSDHDDFPVSEPAGHQSRER